MSIRTWIFSRLLLTTEVVLLTKDSGNESGAKSERHKFIISFCRIVWCFALHCLFACTLDGSVNFAITLASISRISREVEFLFKLILSIISVDNEGSVQDLRHNSEKSFSNRFFLVGNCWFNEIFSHQFPTRSFSSIRSGKYLSIFARFRPLLADPSPSGSQLCINCWVDESWIPPACLSPSLPRKFYYLSKHARVNMKLV